MGVDDDDHVLATVPIPSMPPPPMPPSSSNSGHPAATAQDPFQQQDPWQQGASKKRPFGGSHNGPGTPSVTHEELSIG
eukprot:6659272-Karenia_brevis.AAC.1